MKTPFILLAALLTLTAQAEVGIDYSKPAIDDSCKALRHRHSLLDRNLTKTHEARMDGVPQSENDPAEVKAHSHALSSLQHFEELYARQMKTCRIDSLEDKERAREKKYSALINAYELCANSGKLGFIVGKRWATDAETKAIRECVREMDKDLLSD